MHFCLQCSQCVALCVTGNICRSPAAGAVLKHVVKRSGVAGEFQIDSCGTGGSGHEEWYGLNACSLTPKDTPHLAGTPQRMHVICPL